ncbi:hypothetical protein GCM10029976_071110 [Kribbella albertanoniae]
MLPHHDIGQEWSLRSVCVAVAIVALAVFVGNRTKRAGACERLVRLFGQRAA